MPAFLKNTQKMIPKKTMRSRKPHFNVVAGIVERNCKVLIGKRPINGLLGGMWEFPGGKIEEGEDHCTALKRELAEELDVKSEINDAFGIFKHAYTHFSVTVYPYFVKITKGKPIAKVAERIAWVTVKDLKNYPMGKVDRRISDNLLKKEKSYQ